MQESYIMKCDYNREIDGIETIHVHKIYLQWTIVAIRPLLQSFKFLIDNNPT